MAAPPRIASRIHNGIRPAELLVAPVLDSLATAKTDHFGAKPVLENLWSVLAPGGFAVVKVPNCGSLNRKVMGARWCGFRYPDHLNYFTPKALGTAKAGFGISFGLTGRQATSDNVGDIGEE